MDEFAQSREDDDLFADEFEPIPEPKAIIEQTPPSAETGTGSKPVSTIPSGPSGQRNANRQQRVDQLGGRDRQQGGHDNRQRGGRGGASTQNGLSQSRYAPQNGTTPAAATATTISDSTVPADQPAPTQASSASPPTPSSDPQNPPSQPPITTESNIVTSTRTPAVRGDRSATGGPLHKKLTEEELTAKLEKMAILNAQKAERHRLSEADQAAFQHREKELAKERKEKRVEEQKNSRQMEMERAKNRQRKMQAQGVREWDSEKVESDIVDGKSRGRSSQYVRGGHGGVIRGSGAGLASSKYAESQEGDDNQVSRGRGAFEIRGRGRGGRGNRGGKSGGQSQEVPVAEDFPLLPAPTLSANNNVDVDEKVKLTSSDKPAGDWAEEMATPVEEKKITL